MELNHEVVKDLFPLYIENELRPTVREAVDTHLKMCEDCRNSYETGDGLIAPLQQLDDPKVPNTLDEKLLLRLKLIRFKWITLFLAGLILTIIITDYKNDREKLFIALNQYYSTQMNLPGIFEIVKNKEYSELENLQELIYQFFEDQITLSEHFNFLEKLQLKNTEYNLSLETSKLNKMLEIMQYRYDQGIWSKTDETAYLAIQQHFKELNLVITKEQNEMNHGYSSYLETLNIKDMENFYKNINLLSDSYTRFHKLPEQLQLKEESKLRQQIVKALEISTEKIELKRESPLNYNPYTYRINISDRYYGLIDGLSGQILEVHGGHEELTDGPLMSKEEAEKTARKYIEKIYGKKINFNLVSLGFNSNYTSNDPRFKVYSYKVVPEIMSYKLYSAFGQGSIIHIDARTGKLNMFIHNQNVPTLNGFNQTDLSIEVSKESLNEKGLGVKETVVIYSAISGTFELVHMNPDVIDSPQDKFYSTKSGKEEWISFSE
jgi:hypothetical protein